MTEPDRSPNGVHDVPFPPVRLRVARQPRGYLLSSAADANVRWLVNELGRNGLSGYFRRGPALVVCNRITDEGYEAPEEGDDNGPATIGTADGLHVVGSLAIDYRITRMKGRGKSRHEEGDTFPQPLANVAVRQLTRAPHLRELRSITHTPIVRANGSILSEPGYDDSGVLHLPEVDVPPVPGCPTVAERAAAVALLCGMVDQFVWLGEHDLANYLGALLTPLLRLVCPPPYKLLAIGARQPGSGKSLLGKVLRAVHGGVLRASMPYDDAELSKSIGSILTVTTAPVVEFDNVSGILRSPRLDSLLTQPEISDRVLGSSNQPKMINDRLWVITGNNVRLGSDLTRRALWVTIDPGVPNPELRTGFKITDLEAYAKENRAAILHALLTLVAAWQAAGRPMPPERSSDTYAAWRAVVGGILTHAGVPGEFDAPESAQQEQSADDEGWTGFYEALFTLWGPDHEWPTSEVAELLMHPQRCTEAGLPPLSELLPGDLGDRFEKGQSITRSLGKLLDERKGRWSGRYAVYRSPRDGRGHVALWYVRRE